MQEHSQSKNRPTIHPFANFDALSPLLSQQMINPNSNSNAMGSPAHLGDPLFNQMDVSPN